jgi:hypothetical protein
MSYVDMEKETLHLLITTVSTVLTTFVGCYFTYKAAVRSGELRALKKDLILACKDLLTFREIEATCIELIQEKEGDKAVSYDAIKNKIRKRVREEKQLALSEFQQPRNLERILMKREYESD